MNIILNKKKNDCVICAYATCEGVSWKIAKRRLKKHLTSRKKLGVSSNSVRDRGINGYSILSTGSFTTLNKLFGFKTGVIFIAFGDGNGHALAWDGFKLIDNKSNGRFNNKTNLNEMRKGETVNLVMIKKKHNPIVSVFSYLAHIINKCKI